MGETHRQRTFIGTDIASSQYSREHTCHYVLQPSKRSRRDPTLLPLFTELPASGNRCSTSAYQELTPLARTGQKLLARSNAFRSLDTIMRLDCIKGDFEFTSIISLLIL